jgi:transposase
LHDINPAKLLGDKGYDSDDIRDDLARARHRARDPIKPQGPDEYDCEPYKRRNLIERCVNRLKQFRRIATRYEKSARAYLSMYRGSKTLDQKCQHDLQVGSSMSSPNDAS